MQNYSRNNFISIAKAIGIILMVIGHSGCPVLLSKFLYMFHMPLFFICSGYFFKEISCSKSFLTFCAKKVKGLYLPYIKWSLLFLLLHNIFFRINIYNTFTNSYLYHTSDFGRQLIKSLFMTDYELLIRPFWFIKELFFSTILIALFSFLRTKFFPQISTMFLLTSGIIITVICKFTKIHLLIIGNCSILAFCIVYFYSGIIFRENEHRIPFNFPFTILALGITLIGSFYFIGDVDMRYTTTQNIIPYYFLSLMGIIMTFNISKWLETLPLRKCLYYIGSHTMPILALNLLALKLGSILKIYIFDMPIEKLSNYTVIYEHNHIFWIIYATVGVAIPLLCHFIFCYIKQKTNISWKIIGNSK